MSALSIRRDRTPTVLRKLAKGESDARVTRRLPVGIAIGWVNSRLMRVDYLCPAIAPGSKQAGVRGASNGLRSMHVISVDAIT